MSRSRRHSASRHPLLVTSLIAIASLALFAPGCSSKSTDAPPATVSGPTFNFSFPATGVSHQLQFTDVGSWGYHCNAHGSSGMTGTITVDASSVVDSALVQVGGGTGIQFVPASVTIKQNGFVRWVNVSALTNHTATRP